MGVYRQHEWVKELRDLGFLLLGLANRSLSLKTGSLGNGVTYEVDRCK
jgi:hypothetical protein